MTSVIPWVELRDRISLEAVATTLLGTSAKRSGRRLFWRCPWHNDHDPSFEVDLTKGRWRCWPCNLGGDAAALVMKVNGISFPGSWLGATFGLVTPTAPSKPRRRPPERSSGLPLADALALVTEAAGRLWSPEGKALAYLHGRGLTDETIQGGRLGVVGWLDPDPGGGPLFQARGWSSRGSTGTGWPW